MATREKTRRKCYAESSQSIVMFFSIGVTEGQRRQVAHGSRGPPAFTHLNGGMSMGEHIRAIAESWQGLALFYKLISAVPIRFPAVARLPSLLSS